MVKHWENFEINIFIDNFNSRKSDSEESYGTIESGRSIEDSMPISCRFDKFSGASSNPRSPPPSKK